MGANSDHRRARTVDELSPAQVDMIQSARERAAQRAERRELATELAVAAAFVATSAAMAAVLGPAAVQPLLCAWLAAICAVMVRIEFEAGEGVTRPIQLAVVPMLLLLPPAAVPAVAGAAHVVARLPEVLARRTPVSRLVLAVSDSWTVVAPALVLSLWGAPDVSIAGAAILAGMVVAQIVGDAVVSALRMAIGVGVDPRRELRAFMWVYLVDVCLVPVGVLAAVAGRVHPLAVAGVLPLGALLALFARERRGRVQSALELHHLAQTNEERLQSIVQNSSDLIAIVDAEGLIGTLTGSVEPVFGIDWQAAHGRSLRDFAHSDDAALASAFLCEAADLPAGENHEGTWRMRYHDGTWHHVTAVAANLLADERVGGLVVTVRDVDERVAFEEQLRHRAFHDPLTSLANRALFYDRVEHALNRQARDEGHTAVLFVDLDDFKDVNDRLGHATGDQVLIEVAGRLRSSVRTSDTAARLGGDEFGVLLELVGSANEPVQTAERIIAALAEPVLVDGRALPLTVSVGIAVSATGDRGADELLGHADVAMYAAKRKGKNRAQLYDAALAQAMAAPQDSRPSWFMRSDEQREEVLALLAREDALAIHCQPILDLRTGRVAGYEALARFQGEFQRPPDVWFAQAHRCGLGHRLEARAIAAALSLPGRPDGTYLTLNMSPSGLRSPEVRAVLPERLEGIVVEITEDQLVSDDPAITAEIATLRGRGARLAVDDTGAGYAGLTHIMLLAPDLIKLDRALVAGVEDDPAKAALIQSFVRYGRDIGATVCAEGIETLGDLMRLADLDVAYGQGWVIARPAPPWAGAAAEAAQTCLTSFTATLGAPEPRVGDRLEVLAEHLSRAAGPEGLDPLRGLIAEELAADAVAVHLLDGDALRCYADPPLGVPARLCGSMAGAALAQERLRQVLVSDATADGDAVAELLATGLRSRLTAPILRGGVTVGVLEAFCHTERPWSRFEIGRARIIAHQLGAAIERSCAGPTAEPVGHSRAA